MNSGDTSNEKTWPTLAWPDVADRALHQTFQLRRHSLSGTAFVVGQGIEANSNSSTFIFSTAWHCVSDLLDEDDFQLYRYRDGCVIDGSTNNIAIARLGPPEWDLAFLFARFKSDVLPPRQMMPVRGATTLPYFTEPVIAAGYPSSLGGQPAITNGGIVSLIREPYSYLANCPAYPGMSGGPILDQKAHIVGVICASWHDPNFSHGVPLTQIATSAMIRHVLESRMGSKIIDDLPDPPHN